MPVEKSIKSTPEFYIANVLNLRSFTTLETKEIIQNFAERVKEGLQSPIQAGPGPMMLRSHISPPETPLTEFLGKKAIGIDIDS